MRSTHERTPECKRKISIVVVEVVVEGVQGETRKLWAAC